MTTMDLSPDCTPPSGERFITLHALAQTAPNQCRDHWTNEQLIFQCCSDT